MTRLTTEQAMKAVRDETADKDRSDTIDDILLCIDKLGSLYWSNYVPAKNRKAIGGLNGYYDRGLRHTLRDMAEAIDNGQCTSCLGTGIDWPTVWERVTFKPKRECFLCAGTGDIVHNQPLESKE